MGALPLPFQEPFAFFAAVYDDFLYGPVYLFNEAFPLAFGHGKGRDFSPGEPGLSFLDLAVGPIVPTSCFERSKSATSYAK